MLPHGGSVLRQFRAGFEKTGSATHAMFGARRGASPFVVAHEAGAVYANPLIISDVEPPRSRA